MNRLSVDSDNAIVITDITVVTGENNPAPASVTSVTARLYQQGDASQTTLANSAISLSLVSGQSGVYQGTFPSTVALVVDHVYIAEVTIVADGLTRVGGVAARAEL